MSNKSEMRKIEDALPDFPQGLLTPYRNLASFDWRKLRLALEDEEIILYKHSIWSMLESDPLCYPAKTQSLEDIRRISVRRFLKYRTKIYFSPSELIENPKRLMAQCETFFNYDLGSFGKIGLSGFMVPTAVRTMGTEKHQKFIEEIEDKRIIACFALTEVAHGSNAKGIKTTATFDPSSRQFVLNTVDFMAAKCWVGNLGQSATHAILFARLISLGQDYGLHAFIVPIRSRLTLQPFAGVIVGDIGEKLGLNGLDNGFVMFNEYRIPYDSLLDRLAQLDDEGNYVTAIADPDKRFASSLLSLSYGRILIAGQASNNLLKAVTIAVRYSAVRAQFGPETSDREYAILEYQQQQLKLIPYVASTYAFWIFNRWFSELSFNFVMESVAGNISDEFITRGMEIHALSSACKFTMSWVARDGIQISREACGGHGYLKAAGIGDIRNDNDANCTHEGDNTVLMQQTGNWLLSLLKQIQRGQRDFSPLNSAGYQWRI